MTATLLHTPAPYRLMNRQLSKNNVRNLSVGPLLLLRTHLRCVYRRFGAALCQGVHQ